MFENLEESWKDVIEYPDLFMVSNHGRVWSKRTGRILKQNKSKTGYLTISSRIGGRKGTAINRRVHRWVAEAFIPNPENKPFVNHIDGVKTNNKVYNLEWCTSSENTAHAVKTGLIYKPSGCGHEASKLTETQIRYIREHYVPRCKEFGCRPLGEMFGVHHTQISRIVRRVSYFDH